MKRRYKTIEIYILNVHLFPILRPPCWISNFSCRKLCACVVNALFVEKIPKQLGYQAIKNVLLSMTISLYNGSMY